MNCSPGVAAKYNLSGLSLEEEKCLDEENVTPLQILATLHLWAKAKNTKTDGSQA